MTERTYGVYELTLTVVEDTCDWTDTEKDMAAHIRELQAENAKLKVAIKQHEDNAAHLHNRVGAYQDEIDKLKAERREFGVRIGEAIIKAYFSGKHNNMPIETIVEQELNK